MAKANTPAQIRKLLKQSDGSFQKLRRKPKVYIADKSRKKSKHNRQGESERDA